MSGAPMTWCAVCTRLIDNYSAAAERRAPTARKLLAKYDEHGLAVHNGRGSG